MRQIVIKMALTAGMALGCAMASQAAAPPPAKIKPERAKTIAARKLHGKAISAKYEFEDGRWQYGVIVRKGKDMYEVEVDSNTGKVLDTEKTSPAEEAKEAAEEKSGAKGSEANEKGEKDEKDEGSKGAK